MPPLRRGPCIKAGALLLLTVLLLGIYELVSPERPPVRFSSLKEFEEFARSQGLFVHSGGENPDSYLVNYYVADHPLTREHLLAIPTKTECGLTPGWRGIVWIAVVTGPSGTLLTQPGSIGGKWRIWGNLLVAGDEGLMAAIETRYRAAKRAGRD
jgi:hypothetical protein